MDMQNLIKAMDILEIDYENPSSAVSQLYLEDANNEIVPINQEKLSIAYSTNVSITKILGKGGVNT